MSSNPRSAVLDKIPFLRRFGFGCCQRFVELTELSHALNRRSLFSGRYTNREAFLILGCIMICWSALVSWSPLC